MKKLITVLAFASTAFAANAQLIEAKVNPLGLLFNSPEVSVEFGMNERFSLEGAASFSYAKFLGFKNNGFGGRVFAKYYLGNNLEKPMTKFWFGGYFCGGTNKYSDATDPTDFFTNNRVAAGVAVGYKFLAGDNFVIETAAGGGRAFVNTFTFSGGTASTDISGLIPIDIYSAIRIGWRFNNGGGNGFR